MGLFEWLFGGRRKTPRVDGIPVCLIEPEDVARRMRRPDDANWDTTPLTACSKCGARVQEQIVATDVPGGTAALWDRVAIVVDAWVCTRCNRMAYPRHMEPQRISSFGRIGTQLAAEGRFREAEWWFTRITWDWTSWPDGHLNLAQAVRGRLEATKDLGVKNRLERRAEFAYETAIGLAGRPGTPEHSLDHLAFAHLGLAELALQRRAPEAARRAVEACLAIENLDPAQKARAQQVSRYLDEEVYVFAEAAAIVDPFMNLMDRPPAPVDTPETRKRLAQAVETLERHYGAHPTHWQSIFMAAMGCATLGEPQRTLGLWRRAAANHPGQPDIARECVLALLDAEQNEEARAINRQATEFLPEDATLWANRALAEVVCGDLDAAKECAQRSLALDPQDTITQTLRQRLDTLSPDRLPRSLREFEQD